MMLRGELRLHFFFVYFEGIKAIKIAAKNLVKARLSSAGLSAQNVDGNVMVAVLCPGH